jgi:hypothetical protein
LRNALGARRREHEEFFCRKISVHFEKNYFMVSKIHNPSIIYPSLNFDKYFATTKLLSNILNSDNIVNMSRNNRPASSAYAPERRKPSIQKAIIKMLAGKQAVSLETLKNQVENSIKLPKESGNSKEYAISRSVKNLASLGLIECFQSDYQPYFRLSNEGKKRLNSNILDDDTALVSNNWDGYWRIIILDLPEERKNEREALRYLLKKAGFICIKNSVWISIYPYEHLFTNIKKDLGLTTEMMIVVTNNIDKETEKEFITCIRK